MANTAPKLTNVTSTVTFAENTVNAAPQLIDTDVTFTDLDNNFNGGTLTVSGLLAEDSISIRHQGTAAGQIGFSAGTVTYGGTAIGTVTGGTAGASLSITFNASATATAIDALIQNLTYANSSDTPTASRTLKLTVTDAAGDATRYPSFTEATGASNLFDGVDVGLSAHPMLADVNGDGLVDAVVGAYDGTLLYYKNTGTAIAPVFTLQTANPFSGIDVNLYAAPALADVDGDGDLDVVVGDGGADLAYFKNTGTKIAPSYAEQTGNNNPFDGIYVGSFSTPTLADVDGDGDLDAVVGNGGGSLNYFKNTGNATAPTYVAQADADNPFNGIDVGDSSNPRLVDVDGDGDLDLVVGDFDVALNYYKNTGSATAPNYELQTGAADPFNGLAMGELAAPALADIDGDGDLDAVVGEFLGNLRTFINNPTAGIPLTVTVTAQNDKPKLTGVASTVTFAENTVNTAPQLIDADVTFTDPESNFNGATLTVSGLLAEDSVAIRDQGTGAGQIGFASGTVTYSGVAIGTVTGGTAGATLSVAFNASATATAIDALIENLTYANASDTPTASRTLTISVTDAAGLTFTEQTGTANPFDGIDVGNYSTPALADLDGDGDLDAVVGASSGTLRYYNNTGTATAPVYVEQTGSNNPFNSIIVGTYAAPALADIDGDGDLDAIIGEESSTLNYYKNIGSANNPVYLAQTGTANPFDGIGLGLFSAPTIADVDGDGDLDAVIGDNTGKLKYFKNIGTAKAPSYEEQTGAANPFIAVGGGSLARSALADIDRDGDLDAVVGRLDGRFDYYKNTGSATAPVYVAQTGAGNPFDGIDIGNFSAPTLADVDGDGDIDAVIGEFEGHVLTFLNTTSTDVPLTVTVTAENDAPTLNKNAGLTVAEGGTGVITASRLGYSDAEQTDANLVYKITSATAGSVLKNDAALALNQTFTQGDINAGLIKFRQDGSEGASAGFGFQLSDGQGATITSSFAVTVTPVNDAPVGAPTVSLSAGTEDVAYTVNASDLLKGFTDAENDKLSIAALKASTGSLKDNGNGTYTITQAANFNGNVTLTYGVSDGKATLGGQSRQYTVNAVNDAPTGVSKTITTNEDTAYTFKAADFGFSDAIEGHALKAVKITSLPVKGTLKLNGVAVTLNQAVAAADIGKLVFSPAANANGASYASFGFKVQDTGGTANGGLDTDTTAKTITFNVTAVDDAPTAIVATNVRGPIAENASTATAIKFADLAITDIDGGSNVLSLSGADAGLFTITSGALYLKAGALLDFETNPKLDVTVSVKPTGGAISASKAFSFNVTDTAEIVPGSTGPDNLVGNPWTEVINGGAGNDTINGGGGDDTITGGTGRDIMTGGEGRDVFAFGALDSAPGVSGYISNGPLNPLSGATVRDVITDFTPEVDLIDLIAIDAQSAVAGDQAFVFKGLGAFAAAGDLIYRQFDVAGTADDKTIIYGDVNGDRAADFQIELTGLKTLTAADFKL